MTEEQLTLIPEDTKEEESKVRVGMLGFLCPRTHQPVEYEYCFTKCPDPCKPVPELISLMSDRIVTEGKYSVTELLNPPQQTYLARHHGYYDYPNSQIWATFGSAWHGVMENRKVHANMEKYGIQDDYVKEELFEFELGGVLIRGKADLYDIPRKILWDYKTVKAYFAKQIKKTKDWSGNNYQMQMNIYKWFKFPDAEILRLEALIKDWSERVGRTDKIEPTEIIEVPILPYETVKGKLEKSIRVQLDIEDGKIKPPPCSREETWYGRKCSKFCSSKHVCPQFNAEVKS